MPPKTSAKAKPQDLETVVQIALDAADAAMDVTSEFARISSEFQKAKKSLSYMMVLPMQMAIYIWVLL